MEGYKPQDFSFFHRSEKLVQQGIIVGLVYHISNSVANRFFIIIVKKLRIIMCFIFSIVLLLKYSMLYLNIKVVPQKQNLFE